MWSLQGRALLDPFDGSITSNPIITFRDGKIHSLTSVPGVPLHTTNLFLLPGLADCHTHITYSFTNGRFGWEDDDLQTSLNKAVENCIQTLKAGFTTIRNLGDSDGLDYILRDNKVGPRMLISGEPITRSGQSFPTGVDVIKVFHEGQISSMSQIVNQAHQLGLPVSVHAYSPKSILDSVQAGCNSIEHGTFFDEKCAQKMARRQVMLVPTLSLPHHYLSHRSQFNFKPEQWQHFERMASQGAQSFQLARRYQVPIAFGTDAIAGMHGQNANEFIYMNQAGMSPLECIQTATVNAAKLLRCPIGRVIPGNFGDIIGVDSNPLEDLTTLQHVRMVIKDGKLQL